jgi:hypothetical protein
MKGKIAIFVVVGILTICIMPALAEESTDFGSYPPHNLTVCATDIFGNVNTSVSIQLAVILNGDVSDNGEVTLYDAMYLAKHVLGKPGFETMNERVGEVSGNSEVTLYDAMYLSKHVLGESGFETLH